MTINRDKRVSTAFPKGPQSLYMRALEARVSSIETPDYAAATPTITASVETGNAITVNVQLRSTVGLPLTYQSIVRAFLSAAIPGIATATDTSAAIATQGTILQEEVTRAAWTIASNTSGYFDLALGHAAAGTFYLNIIQGDRLYTSSGVTFA